MCVSEHRDAYVQRGEEPGRRNQGLAVLARETAQREAEDTGCRSEQSSLIIGYLV